MTDSGIALREFAYLDRKKVGDFLSGIENGLAKEKTEIRRGASAELSGKLGLSGLAEVQGGIEQERIDLEELKVATDASLFRRLYDHLKNQALIRFVDQLDSVTWNSIRNGEVLEIVGQVELSAMENLIDLLNNILPIMKPQVTDEKGRLMVQFIEMLSAQSSVNVKITTASKNFKFVASLPKGNIRVTKQELNSLYRVVCRVQKTLEPNETFDLFSLVPGANLSRKQLRGFTRSLASPSMKGWLGKSINLKDFRISYPAMIVTPIAIYR
jgi:hypothetical protein